MKKIYEMRLEKPFMGTLRTTIHLTAKEYKQCTKTNDWSIAYERADEEDNWGDFDDRCFIDDDAVEIIGEEEVDAAEYA